MKLKKIALVGGAVTLALSAMVVAACSSSTPSVTVPPGVDGGGPQNTDGGPVTNPADTGPVTNPDSGPIANGDSGPGADSGPSCGSTPSLHPTAAGTVFCGYDDAGALDCLADSGTPQCCLGGKVGSAFAPQVCGAFGTACTNGTSALPIECGQISDCTANGATGAACCLQGVTGAPAILAGCGYYKEQGGTAVTCEVADGGSAEAGGGGAPACATGEVQICTSDTDCPTGKTCTPMKWKLYQLGFCL